MEPGGLGPSHRTSSPHRPAERCLGGPFHHGSKYRDAYDVAQHQQKGTESKGAVAVGRTGVEQGIEVTVPDGEILICTCFYHLIYEHTASQGFLQQ